MSLFESFSCNVDPSKKQAARQDVREMTAPPPAKIRRVTPEMTNGTPGPASRLSLGGNLNLSSGHTGKPLLSQGQGLRLYVLA